MQKLTKVFIWLAFFVGVAGTSFVLLAILMYLAGAGNNPLTVVLIGYSLLVSSYIIMAKATPQCPRCGSKDIKNGVCQICDYRLED